MTPLQRKKIRAKYEADSKAKKAQRERKSALATKSNKKGRRR